MSNYSLMEIYRSSAAEVRLNASFASEQTPVKLGRIYLVNHDLPPLPSDDIPETQIEKEISLVEQAFNTVRTHYEEKIDDPHLPAQARQNFKEILEAYNRMAVDIEKMATNKITNNKQHAETAVNIVHDESFDYFDEKNRPDLKTICHAVIRELLRLKGKEHPGPALADAPQDCIIIGDTISPSDTTLFLPKNIRAIVLTEGTPTGHVAILSNDLDIPCSFIPEMPPSLHNDAPVICDPKKGEIIFNPSEKTLSEYSTVIETQEKQRHARMKYRDIKPTFKNGEPAHVLANVTSAPEVEKAKQNGADSIGLWRTELLFTSSANEPSIDMQKDEYAYGLKTMEGKPCTFRLVDREGDKCEGWLAELNHDEFIALKARQIEAILRASAETGFTASIMLPVVRELSEMRWLNETIAKTTEDLEKEGLTVPTPHKVMMIEIPKTAHPTMLRHYMDYADSFSIGSNDLVEWFSGGLRNIEGYENVGDPTNPAFLQLMSDIIALCNDNGKPVSLCGNIASKPFFAKTLAGCGLKHFSVGTENIPDIKATILRINSLDAEQFVENLIQEVEPSKRQQMIEIDNEKYLGIGPNGTLEIDWEFSPEEHSPAEEPSNHSS